MLSAEVFHPKIHPQTHPKSIHKSMQSAEELIGKSMQTAEATHPNIHAVSRGNPSKNPCSQQRYVCWWDWLGGKILRTSRCRIGRWASGLTRDEGLHTQKSKSHEQNHCLFPSSASATWFKVSSSSSTSLGQKLSM